MLICILTLFASCREVVTEFDCGEVETEITELSHQVGSYTSATFINNISSNFEEAAIVIYIDKYGFITETATSCFAFTPIPQLIEKISITSSNSVTIGGIEFAPGEVLNGLFKVHNQEQTYSISAFITAQNKEPSIFHVDTDEIVLQLLTQPDATINQSLAIEITFDDLKIMTIDIPTFEVTN